MNTLLIISRDVHLKDKVVSKGFSNLDVHQESGPGCA